MHHGTIQGKTQTFQKATTRAVAGYLEGKGNAGPIGFVTRNLQKIR
jgi:hypothetical protein